MIKLYKLVDNELHYWECWDSEKKSAIIHWGIVGHKGETKEIKIGLFSNFSKSVQKELNGKLIEGYGEFEEDKLSFLEIEFEIERFGNEQDISKRHELEQKMDEILGWTGLGHMHGGSIGSGTMEVGCMVVDYKIAKKIIERELAETKFADYKRIYKME